MAVTDSRRGARTNRVAGVWGWTFTLLLLVSAGMASVPGGADADSKIRDFYTAHAGVIVAAQVISLAASATFVLFTLALRRGGSALRTGLGRVEVAGLAVAVASGLTVVPPLWLTAVADSASSSTVHRLAVASDLVDVVLFLAIGFFGSVLAPSGSSPWFRVLSAFVAVLAVARAVSSLLGSAFLDLVAPLAFVALVVVVSTLALLGRSPVPTG